MQIVADSLMQSELILLPQLTCPLSSSALCTPKRSMQQDFRGLFLGEKIFFRRTFRHTTWSTRGRLERRSALSSFVTATHALMRALRHRRCADLVAFIHVALVPRIISTDLNLHLSRSLLGRTAIFVLLTVPTWYAISLQLCLMLRRAAPLKIYACSWLLGSS